MWMRLTMVRVRQIEPTTRMTGTVYGRWVATVAFLLCVVNFVEACPASCICKWKGGKQFVDCSNKDLITIPEGMDQGTQVLDFSGNNLQSLQKERFQKMDLINLQRIYLSRCKISRIDDRAFAGLTNLVELDLSENMINSVPSGTFADYPSLMRLTISDNPVKIIRSFAFHELTYLTTLELSNCEIETVEDEAFAGLTSLEWLKLDGNRLATIRGSDILPNSLHGIDLHRNRWVCDCRMLDLHTWLLNFNIPLAVEPKCSRPARLSGRTIKSIDPGDLACLPDISPTTLYLEIGEGKNVSLLCKVSAIPEAHVSWWFQGQLLQNDTTIAPGYHLLYYIEEGTIEKRSELFIYNTNSEDNGTFVCAAENSAGKSLSNYTIRVIVKEEPVVIIVPFPFEYFVAIAAGAAALAILIIIGIAIAIVKCRRNRQSRKKKDCGKEVALQSQQGKCAVLCENAEPLAEPIKVNGNVVNAEQHETLLYASLPSSNIVIGGADVPTVMTAEQFRSPPFTKNFHTEQNPDLINDTESVGKGVRRRDGENGEDEPENSAHNSYQEAMDNIINEYDGVKPPPPTGARRVQWQDAPVVYTGGLATLPRGGSHELYQHAADVHLNPGCFMDSDGYPPDYGLPKRPSLPTHPPAEHSNYFYRTLPHNRSKMSAATPGMRFSREAEFLSRSAQPPSYEHYNPSTDIRYTAEGYPCATQRPSSANKMYAPPNPNFSADGTFIPSPPEGYKTNDPMMSPSCCTSPPLRPHWPPCLPSGFQSAHHHPTKQDMPVQMSPTGVVRCPTAVTKRCVGAQTEQPVEKSTAPQGGKSLTAAASGPTTSASSHHSVHEVLTESPDEGYGGDGAESVEI